MSKFGFWRGRQAWPRAYLWAKAWRPFGAVLDFLNPQPQEWCRDCQMWRSGHHYLPAFSLIQIRKLDEKVSRKFLLGYAFGERIITRCSNDCVFGRRCWGQSLKSPQKGIVPSDGGLYVGPTWYVPDNEVVFIAVWHPLTKVKNRRDPCRKTTLTSSPFADLSYQAGHGWPVVDPEAHWNCRYVRLGTTSCKYATIRHSSKGLREASSLCYF